MPYGGTTPEQDTKIDSCIKKIKGTNKRTGKPYTKQEKIAICKAQVLKSEIVDVENDWYAVILGEENLCSSIVEKLNRLDFTVIDDEDGLFESVVEAAKLTHQQRKGLKDSAYCLIQRIKGKSGKVLVKRRFPAHDAAHVRNGLAQLSKAKNLTPAERAKIKTCLVSRAKKYKITVGSTLEFQALDYSMMESSGIESEEMETLQAIIPTDRGTFWVMAGMEGQKAMYEWEIRKVEASFFEKRYKDFKGKFYYPGHERSRDVSARVARVVKSELRKVGKAQKLAMFHEIKPKNAQVSSDIEEGYLSDVSIDALEPIMAEDNDKSIVDALPYGVAFVAALPKMKGCPTCKVVHDPTESCITSECPTGTSEVSGQINENTEVVKLTEKKVEKVEKTVEEPSGEKASGSGVPDEKYKKMQSEQATLRTEMDELMFGNAVVALSERAKVEKSVVMAIVTGETPQDRMNSLESIIKAFEDEKKKIVAAKVVEDDKIAATGSGEVETGEGVYHEKKFKATLAKLEGKAFVTAETKPKGDA